MRFRIDRIKLPSLQTSPTRLEDWGIQCVPITKYATFTYYDMRWCANEMTGSSSEKVGCCGRVKRGRLSECAMC